MKERTAILKFEKDDAPFGPGHATVYFEENGERHLLRDKENQPVRVLKTTVLQAVGARQDEGVLLTGHPYFTNLDTKAATEFYFPSASALPNLLVQLGVDDLGKDNYQGKFMTYTINQGRKQMRERDEVLDKSTKLEELSHKVEKKVNQIVSSKIGKLAIGVAALAVAAAVTVGGMILLGGEKDSDDAKSEAPTTSSVSREIVDSTYMNEAQQAAFNHAIDGISDFQTRREALDRMAQYAINGTGPAPYVPKK